MSEKLRNGYSRFGKFFGKVLEKWSQMGLWLMFIAIAYNLLYVYESKVALLFDCALIIVGILLPGATLGFLRSKKYTTVEKKNVRKAFILINVVLLIMLGVLFPKVAVYAIPLLLVTYAITLYFSTWYNNLLFGFESPWLKKMFNKFPHIFALIVVGVPFVWYLHSQFLVQTSYTQIVLGSFFTVVFTILANKNDLFSVEKILLFEVDEKKRWI